jgi:hypothetical protein
MKGYGPETFGERMAEVYDTWYGTQLAQATTLQTVEVLADLAAGGTVLELAIGTGRVALPLAARGLLVRGIDASEAIWRGWPALNCASDGEGGTARLSRHRVRHTSPCMGGRRCRRQRRSDSGGFFG